MAFAPVETSRHAGSPIALYFFRWGASPGAYFAYTDAEHSVVAPSDIGGTNVTYVPAAILRKNITGSGTLDKTTIEVSIPRNLSLAAKFSIWPPSYVISVCIRQGHLGELSGDYPAVWVGRVVGFSFQGSTGIVALEPFSTSMRRNGLRRNYQYACPYVLFQVGTCNADKAHATIPVNITSAATNVIVMPAAWFGAINVNKYLSGTVEWTNLDGNLEVRTILTIQAGKDLVLDGPTLDLTGGSLISAILGCNRNSGIGDASGDCTNLHIERVTGYQNIINFGGDPWIPFVNPMGNTNTPYY